MLTTKKVFGKRIGLAFASLVLVFASVPFTTANAAQLTSRSITLGSSVPNASTTHKFDFTIPASVTVGSIDYEYCTTASGACTAPTGLNVDGVTAGTQTGATGFTVDATRTIANRIGVTRTAAAANGAVEHTFNVAINPTATNTTFFVRIQTYATATFTTTVDSGVVSGSTATQITVNATVNETLVFCTGTSGVTASSCAGATGNSVNLGSLNPSSSGTGTSQIGISTNAGSGYAVTVNGTTLTSGANTIAALATQTTSATGSPQFGINLLANTSPVTFGLGPQGTGTGTPDANYNTTNQYRFVTGDRVAFKASSDDFRLYTVSHLANIPGSQPAGAYSAALTYIATATY